MNRLTTLLIAFTVALPTVATAQQTDEVRYYHLDAIGSVRMVTDAGGQPSQAIHHEYLPFGQEYLPPTNFNVRRFAGKEFDTETGYDYFGGRFYRSASGRFTSVDPVLDISQALVSPQRWNRYTYSLNAPLKFTDPDGRDPRLIGAAIGVAVYAGWNAYVNVNQGQPWYQNIGVEASKGFLVGVTLGLAAPALAAATTSEAVTPLATAAAAGVGGQPALSSRRDQLLSVARHPGLRDAIDNLFRPNATVGDGSSMAAYAHEIATGQLLSPTGHGQKLLDRLGQLGRLLRRTDLSEGDREIAEGLIREINKVLR